MMQIFCSGKTPISSLSCVNLRLLPYPDNNIFAAACDRLANPDTRTSSSAALVALKQALEIRSASPFFMHKQRATTTKRSRLLWSSAEDDSHFYVNAAPMMASIVSRTAASPPRVSRETMTDVHFLVQPHRLFRSLVGNGVQTSLIAVKPEFCTCDE